MFTGRDYQSEFDAVCETLSDARKSKDEVRSALLRLEWIIWEAFRGALINGCALFSFIVSALVIYALDIDLKSSWTVGLVALSAFFIFCLSQYAILRFALWEELTRHVRGHKFGGLDLQK
jgi:hypothetical protein